MTKTKVFVSGLTIGLVIAACVSIPLTYHFSKCQFSPGDIVIETPGPLSPTDWIKPNTCPDCGEKIEIFGAVRQRDFHVTAQDECKRNSRVFTLGIVAPVRHHNIMAAYTPLYDIDSRAFRHTLDASYFYSFGRVSLGGGLAVQFDNERLYQAGPRVTCGVTW